ncbi:superoxide dismutase family protein [Paracoccus luteus]|uniref:superoxide dismutase family protein n=1 Tax=Paracoccus luteus TaxID=2508543 RepID=UPI00106FA022|nr:superoxide dismutase family protein [Paracoccus luteus]
MNRPTAAAVAARLDDLRLPAALMLGAVLALAPMAAPGQTTPAPADAAAPADATAAPAADGAAMRSTVAALKGADGADHGQVTVSETASGAIQVTLALIGLPEGERAVHIHETGKCEAPAFESAGGHLAGDKQHGAHAAGGMHSGDLPNIAAAADGAVNADFFSMNVTMDQVMDDDGSAFVIHSGKDDYASQPSGNAGDRVACGVFEAAAN